MDKHRLIVDSVVVRFGQKTVLSGGYITSETGMVTGLLGRNGAGKSCMFRALMGGLLVENVMVSIDEKPIDRQTDYRPIYQIFAAGSADSRRDATAPGL